MFNNSFLKTLDILYVESDKNISKHFSTMLNKMFNSVILEKTSMAAFERFKNNKNDKFDINIIICDVNLSDESGIVFLEKIRELDEEIPCILTSNELNENDVLKAIKLDVSEFLNKPVNAKNLVDSVEKACEDKYQKVAEKQSQDDLENIIEVLDEVAIVSKTSIDGKFIYVNKSFCKLSGYEENELLGETEELLRDESFNHIIQDEIDRSLKEGNKWEGKLKNINKNKEEFYSYVTVVPLYDMGHDLYAYMWIRFLATQDELEQKEFKKKVAQNFHQNRRINNEARNKIDKLQNKILYFKNLNSSLEKEEKRKSKFISQNIFYKKELKEKEKKLKEVNEKASNKIREVVSAERETRIKKDKAVLTLTTLTSELELKNKSIKELTAELDTQKKVIDKLKLKIENRENRLGV